MVLMSLFARIFLISSLAVIAFGHGGSHESDSEDSHTNLRSKSLILVKIWCLIIAFVGTFVGGISPYFFRWNETFLVLGINFAGGVFLGTAWMHFLSDSASTFADLTTKDYPFAFMLCTAGYFGTLLADITIGWVYERQGIDAHSAPITSHVQLSTTYPATVGDAPSPNTGPTPLTVQVRGDAEQGRNAEKTEKIWDGRKSSWGDNILLIFALCFHSVFEGISIGIAKDAADAWRALWTVCLHKIFAAIAMGIALLRMMPNRPLRLTIAYSFAFAISTPIGIAVGILLDATTEGSGADWTYAISMGIATGVFVYVAVNHLLGKGLIHNAQRAIPFDTPFYKFLFAFIGASLIAIVMQWD